VKNNTTYSSLLLPLHKKVPHNKFWSYTTLQHMQDMIDHLKSSIESQKQLPLASNVTEQQLQKIIQRETLIINKLQDKVNFITQYPELNEWYELIELMYNQLNAYALMDDHYEYMNKLLQQQKPLPNWCNTSYFSEQVWDNLTNHQCKGYLPYSIAA
jgi:hypothetical protein